MPGVAAFLVALAGLVGQSPAGPARPLGAHFRSTPYVGALVRAKARPSNLRSCSAQRSQSGPVERKVLPVACEQPPRSHLTLPPSAIVLNPLVGG
jgi:hypothetical protein